MKEIWKMIQFDYQTIRPVSMGVTAAAMILFVLLAFLWQPLAACLMIPFSFLLFAALDAYENKCGFNKLYGILPVRKCSITRAHFGEFLLSAMSSEVLAVLVYRLAKLAGFHLKIKTLFSGVEASESTFFGEEVIWILFIVSIFLICFLRMMIDMFGHENEGWIFLVTFIAVLTGLFSLLHGIYKGKIDISFPVSTGGKLLVILICNLAAAGICLLFCELTVKVLAKREL